jgi:hypothetical protein
VGATPSACGGKSHLSAALGLALVENGWRVMFARTTVFDHSKHFHRRIEPKQTSSDEHDAQAA